MAGRVRRLLRHFKDLRAAEDTYVAARRTVLDALDDLTGQIMPPSGPLAAPVRAVIRTLAEVEASRKRTAEMSVQVVADPLQRFLDNEVHGATEAYKAYGKSVSQLDGLAEKIARAKEQAKATELEAKAAELRK
jgi:hypothetical protein